MRQSDALLREFGQSLGMDDLSWPESAVVALDFQRRGVLYLEELDEHLLIYLVKAFDSRDGRLAILQRALRACHYREGLPFAAQAALRGEDRLVFLVRLALSGVALPDLERVLETLTQLHEKVRQ
jgi:type III secretion system chaperone SycN